MRKDSSDSIHLLQQVTGNRAVQKSVHPKVAGFDFSKVDIIQPKLKINQLGDIYEQEADQVAEHIMGMSTSSEPVAPVTNTKEREEGIDHKCSACEMMKDDEEEREEEMNISRRQSTMSNMETTDEAANKINKVLSNGGSTLGDDTLEFMEPMFGYNFSNVRIHSDEGAARSSNSVNALAYTVGNDIVFGEGQYQPNTLEGRRLLAHELTHVVQQSRAVHRVTDESLESRELMRDLSQEADELNRKFLGNPDGLATVLLDNISDWNGSQLAYHVIRQAGSSKTNLLLACAKILDMSRISQLAENGFSKSVVTFVASELYMAGEVSEAERIAGVIGSLSTKSMLESNMLLSKEDAQLLLELATMVADLTGIVDPSPTSDIAAAFLSVASGETSSAVISLIGIFPYVGDVAKLGKVTKWVKTVTKLVARAAESPTFFKYIRGPLEQVYSILAALPMGISEELDGLKETIKKFFDDKGIKISGTAAKWAWERFYRFSVEETEDFTYKIAEGRLVPPSIAQKHHAAAERAAISEGTGEHAGHLIGRQFGGPEIEENLHLQHGTMNTAEFKKLENQWARLLESGTGVEVKIRVVIPKNNPVIPQGRASGIVAEWTEILPDGTEKMHTNWFLNPMTSGAKSAQKFPPIQDPNQGVIELRPGK